MVFAEFRHSHTGQENIAVRERKKKELDKLVAIKAEFKKHG